MASGNHPFSPQSLHPSPPPILIPPSRLLQRSFSSDLERHLAWERKKRLHCIDEESDDFFSGLTHPGMQKARRPEERGEAKPAGSDHDYADENGDEDDVGDVFDDESDFSENSISSDSSSVCSMEEGDEFATHSDSESFRVEGEANAGKMRNAAETHGEAGDVNQNTDLTTTFVDADETDHIGPNSSQPGGEVHADGASSGVNEWDCGYGSSHSRTGRSVRSYKSVSFSRSRSDQPRRSRSTIARSIYFTDEDMEELRGSIDLGFGFSYDEAYRLKGTLPALELYCAIQKPYADASPPSSNAKCCSNGSNTGSPLQDSFRISSPGDSSKDVKHRLRQWAKAVACSIKEGF